MAVASTKIQNIVRQAQIFATKSKLQPKHWKKLQSTESKFDRTLEILDSIPSQEQRIKNLSRFADKTVLLGIVGMLGVGLLIIIYKKKNATKVSAPQ